MVNVVNSMKTSTYEFFSKLSSSVYLFIGLVLATVFIVVSAQHDITRNDEIPDIQVGQALIIDQVDDSFYGPLHPDPDSCDFGKTAGDGSSDNDPDPSCWHLPGSTIEEEIVVTATSTNAINRDEGNFELGGVSCSFGGNDPDSDLQDNILQQCSAASSTTSMPASTSTTAKVVDKHWGSDPNILRMRDRLRSTGSGESMKRHMARKREENKENDPRQTSTATTDFQQDGVYHNGKPENRRPPIFLMPGLASTRLVAWRPKACKLSEIKVQDPVWLNMNLIFQMSTIDFECFADCLKLGWNQSDTDDLSIGCKLRPDEGLDAISSLSPGSIGPQLLGGVNTVYAWLIQWLADNLGYDVTSIIGLPYDWRLSPDKMESRDGFLTLTRHRIEAAVQSNGEAGIIVAHSMGNLVFRYFLNWLRKQLRREAYGRYVKQAERRQKKSSIPDELRASTTANHSSVRKTGSLFGLEELSHSKSEIHVVDLLPPASALPTVESDIERKRQLLYELAVVEGDEAWYEWVEKHIWTYVGLSAPLLGAANPLRSVISGEKMGLPLANDAARHIEITFGSTHTVNPVSTQEGFCDNWQVDDWGEEPDKRRQQRHADSRLACMDDILTEIEMFADRSRKEPDNKQFDPWKNFPALERLVRKRADWDTDIPMIRIVTEFCDVKEKPPCAEKNVTADFGPIDVQNGDLFTIFSRIWKEKDDPLSIKFDQLRESFWETGVRSTLNETWDRPLIKHVVMAYGVDIPTEVGYEYRKTEKINKDDKVDDKKKSDTFDGVPDDKGNDKKKSDIFDGVPPLSAVIFEREGGKLEEERIENRALLGDLLSIKKTKRVHLKQGTFHHSGDGSVSYMSLAWAHTWLLHAGRALLYSKQMNGAVKHPNEPNDGSWSFTNPLEDIKVSHRPKGATEWKDGPPPRRFSTLGEKKVEESSDTGTYHPHGTKYKPEMIRYHNRGTSRTTGIEYTTTVIEAIGVEHKETTRNYDILAAVFTDVLKCMHDDFNIV